MNPAPIAPFPNTSLEAIAKILGDTTMGLTGSEITRVLALCNVPDIAIGFNKWQRLFNALALKQNESQAGNHVIAFIHKSLDPVAHTGKPERFRTLRTRLLPVLAFSGLSLNEAGRVVKTTKASSLEDALSRANSLKTELERRMAHPEIIKYCREELLRESYFHAVLEAMKGLAERMRSMSGLGSDGAALVTQMFSLGQNGTPAWAINPLTNESYESEQKGFVNLLTGMFGMFRNPPAHAPRLVWDMTETDALDMLGTMSLAHRKLDTARKS